MNFYILNQIPEKTITCGVRFADIFNLMLKEGSSYRGSGKWSIDINDITYIGEFKSREEAEKSEEYLNALLLIREKIESNYLFDISGAEEADCSIKEKFNDTITRFFPEKTEFLFTDIPNKKETIKKIFSEMSNFFGEENFDYTEENRYRGKCIVKFPLVNVENSMGKTHTIHDLYIRLDYRQKEESLCFDIRGGFRTRISPEEKEAGYSFSHLQSGHGDYRGACLGSGPLSLNVNRTIAFDENIEESVLIFCTLLKDYVSWESIEGVPYVRMSKIKTDVLNIKRKHSFALADSFVHHVKKNGPVGVLCLDGNTLSVSSEISQFSQLYTSPSSEGHFHLADFIKQFDIKEKEKSTSITYIGSHFEKFKGQSIGKIAIDPSLSKNKDEELMNFTFTKFVHPNETENINQIIQYYSNDPDFTTKYCEERSIYSLPS